MPNLILKCDCGSFEGRATNVIPAAGNHITCMCDDCQAFLHYLKRADLLDENGGTEIFQLTPSHLTFTRGKEKIRCLRLTAKGLVRWYTDCCKTPIANTTASPKVPFAGLVLACVPKNENGTTRDQAIGPLLCKTQGKFAVGKLPPGASKTAPPAIIYRGLRVFFTAWLQGKAKPTPFFTAENLIATPHIVPTNEREALRALCGPR